VEEVKFEICLWTESPITSPLQAEFEGMCVVACVYDSSAPSLGQFPSAAAS
jgi:hypothetical protein